LEVESSRISVLFSTKVSDGIMMKTFWLCFVPLFVAVDAIGVLPLFMNLTDGVDQRRVRKIVLQGMVTALVVAIVFVAIGELLLKFLGITVADFMVAGGALLFALSLSDLLAVEKHHKKMDVQSLGAVPVGVPLIVGPAVLTTSLLLLRQYGLAPTVPAVVLNVVMAGVVLWFSQAIILVMGKTGAKTVSKLASLLLAAIGVMMVRKGIMLFLIK
jgi:multiple antibiotic resistance protein